MILLPEDLELVALLRGMVEFSNLSQGAESYDFGLQDHRRLLISRLKKELGRARGSAVHNLIRPQLILKEVTRACFKRFDVPFFLVEDE